MEYVAALDVGTRRDLTALAVGHAERGVECRRVMIDRVVYWRPGRDAKVDLSEVKAAALRLRRTYDARLRFDRMQAEQLTGNLTRTGVRTEEFVFSSAGANRLARSIFVALCDRALSLPDEAEVRAEFLSASLVKTGPSTVKLQNPPVSHDDIVTAVRMIVSDLLGRLEVGPGAMTVPQGRIPPRDLAWTTVSLRDRPRGPSPLQRCAEPLRTAPGSPAGRSS